jgi:hypothetical protein
MSRPLASFGDGRQACEVRVIGDLIDAHERAFATSADVIVPRSNELLARHNWPSVARRLVDELTAPKRRAGAAKE